MQKMLITIKMRVVLVVASFLCLSIPWLTLADPAQARHFSVVKIAEAEQLCEPQINNQGQIVWLALPEDAPTVYRQIFQYTPSPGGGPGAISQVTSGRGYMTNLRLNNRGQMVWVEYSTTSGDSINLYTPDPGEGPGTITPLSPTHPGVNDNPQINDQGQVVWQGRTEVYPSDHIFLYNNTFPVVLLGNGRVNYYPQINAGGQIVWQGQSDEPDPVTGVRYDQIFFSPDGGSSTQQLTADGNYNQAPQINRWGEIVWMKIQGGVDHPSYDVYRAQGASITPISTGYTWYPYPKISDTGEIVWVGYEASSAGYCFYSQGVIKGIGASVPNPECNINALGQVAYPTDFWPYIHPICVYNHGDKTFLTSTNSPGVCPRINDRGQVIWLQEDTPGKTALYLASPVGALPGVLQLLLLDN